MSASVKDKRGNPFLRRSWNAAVTRNLGTSHEREVKRTPKRKRRTLAVNTDDDDDDENENGDDDNDNDTDDRKFLATSRQSSMASESSAGMRLRQKHRIITDRSTSTIVTTTAPGQLRSTRGRPIDTKAEPHSLRISISEIIHGSLRQGRRAATAAAAAAVAAAAQVRDVVRTRALCTVTITCSSESSPQPTVVRHRESQMCGLESFCGPQSQHRVATIDLARPFLVLRESLLVNRAGSLQFADVYGLTIELEAGEGPWPPFTPADFGIDSGKTEHFATPSRKWVLKARIADIFKRPQSFVKLGLMQNVNGVDQQHGTDHFVIADIAWASPVSPASLDPAEEADSLQSDEKDPSQSLGHTQQDRPQQKQQQEEVRLEVDAAGDGRTTDSPGRARRNAYRHGISSSKLVDSQLSGHTDDRDMLSGDAQVPTETTTTATAITTPPMADTSSRLFYQFPTTLVQLGGFACAVCGFTHKTLTMLQAHLQVNHEQYEFEMRRDTGGAGERLVCTVRHRTDDDPAASRSLFSRIDPTKTYDDELIAGGDLPFAAVVDAPSDAVPDEKKTTTTTMTTTAKPTVAQTARAPARTLTTQPASAAQRRPGQKHYPPLVHNQDFVSRRLHLSWLLQADLSGLPNTNAAIPAFNSPTDRLVQLWHEWVRDRQFNEFPISLQYEFVYFVRHSQPVLAKSASLRRAVRRQQRVLVENKGMDAPWGEAMLGLLTQAKTECPPDALDESGSDQDDTALDVPSRRSEPAMTTAAKTIGSSSRPSSRASVSDRASNNSLLSRPQPDALSEMGTSDPASTTATPPARRRSTRGPGPYETLNDEDKPGTAPLSMPRRRKRTRSALDEPPIAPICKTTTHAASALPPAAFATSVSTPSRGTTPAPAPSVDDPSTKRRRSRKHLGVDESVPV